MITTLASLASMSSEMLFTLFQAPDVSAEKFEQDATQVERDLATLKALLEDAGPGHRA